MREQRPDVSFVMSVYNGGEFLEETMESIAAQTFSNWECVVIDDCSVDATPDILARWARRDERIRVSRNPENLRLAASLNRGLELARGRYVARVDADDICTPDRLEKQVAFMDSHPELSVSSCKYFTLRGDQVCQRLAKQRTDPEGVRALLLFTNPILHPGVIARTEDMRAMRYDPRCTCTEDLDVWTRMAANGEKLAIQDAYLMIYRLHDKQITATTLEAQRREVRSIAARLYRTCLWEPSDRELDMLLGSIYFRNEMRIQEFTAFLKLVRRSNRRRKLFSRQAIDSAMLGILADYKQSGMARSDIFRGLLCFDPLFLAREWQQRKKRAEKLMDIGRAAALRMGLIPLEERADGLVIYQKPERGV